MNLESPDASIQLNLSPEAVEQLKKLEKKRRFAERRFWLFLLFPILSLPLYGLQLLFNLEYDFLGIAMVVVFFLVGILVFVVSPTPDAVSIEYKKIIVPLMLRNQQIEADYSMGHGLSVESFMKSGLYQDRYSHFERYDSLIGKYQGLPFGLYELAVQVAGGRGGGPTAVGVTPGYKLLTNHFYGWILHVPVRKLSGRTYIVPFNRKTKEECDDWIKKTGEYVFQKSGAKQILTGDPDFDSTFGVCTTNEQEAKAILQAPFRNFLLQIHRMSPGAAAFSFIDNRAYMHSGILGNSFDLKRGEPVFPAQTETLVKRLRFFCAIVMALYSSVANAKQSA